MWAAWNEGSLYSLSPEQLAAFLRRSGAEVEAGAKKNVLVRQVESLLEGRRQRSLGQQGGAGAGAGGGGGGGFGGKWDKSADSAAGENLLDLSQTQLFDTPGAAAGAPRAFQVLFADATPDLVVARTNTAAFPGYAASVEAYTLTAAEPQLAGKARFTKTLQWCFLNLRALGAAGELRLEFGKLILKPEVMQKGRRVVSAYDLQQRLQVRGAAAAGAKPPPPAHHWVGAVGREEGPDIQGTLTALGFGAPSAPAITVDVTVHRAGGEASAVELRLDERGAVVAAHGPWDRLLASHLLRGAGADARLLLRTRVAVSGADAQVFGPGGPAVVDLAGDEVKPVLPAEHGKVIYVSENEERSWTKAIPVGGGSAVLRLTETRRAPLLISRDEEDDARAELALAVDIPPQAREADVASVGAEVLGLAHAIGAAVDPFFAAQFGTDIVRPSPLAE